MKTLRQRFEDIKDEFWNTYRELIKKGNYDFVADFVKDCEDEDIEDIKNLLLEDDYNSLHDYGLHDTLQQIYYNDRHGIERHCYLLSVDKENGLYILDGENDDTFFIGFTDLNGEESKLTVIEEMQNLTKL